MTGRLAIVLLLLAVPARGEERPVIKQLDDTTYEVERYRFALQLTRPRSDSFSWEIDGAKVTGLRVGALAEDSLYAQLGLREGDVIRRVNDWAFDGPDPLALYTAFETLPLKVTLLRGGKNVVLTYQPRRVRSVGMGSRGIVTDLWDAAVALGIVKVDDLHYKIARPLLVRVLNDPELVAMEARIVPSIKDGVPRGFKLYGIRPKSIYRKLGIENGDTITSVNGLSLASPEMEAKAFDGLDKADKLTVEAIRRGEPVTLEYTIE